MEKSLEKKVEKTLELFCNKNFNYQFMRDHFKKLGKMYFHTKYSELKNRGEAGVYQKSLAFMVGSLIEARSKIIYLTYREGTAILLPYPDITWN